MKKTEKCHDCTSASAISENLRSRSRVRKTLRSRSRSPPDERTLRAALTKALSASNLILIRKQNQNMIEKCDRSAAFKYTYFNRFKPNRPSSKAIQPFLNGMNSTTIFHSVNQIDALSSKTQKTTDKIIEPAVLFFVHFVLHSETENFLYRVQCSAHWFK